MRPGAREIWASWYHISRYTVDSAVFIICAFFCQFARPRCQLYAHGKLFLAKAENKNKKLKQTMLTSMLTLTWFYRMYSWQALGWQEDRLLQVQVRGVQGEVAHKPPLHCLDFVSLELLRPQIRVRRHHSGNILHWTQEGYLIASCHIAMHCHKQTYIHNWT